MVVLVEEQVYASECDPFCELIFIVFFSEGFEADPSDIDGQPRV